MAIFKLLDGKNNLPKPIAAVDPACGSSGALYCHQQQPDHQRNHRHRDKQLDDRKTAVKVVSVMLAHVAAPVLEVRR